MVKLLTTPIFGFLVVLVSSLLLFMNEQSSSHVLVFVTSLAMVYLCCYDPITHRLHISLHVEFWEYHHFTSLQQFPMSSFSESSIFTDLFLPLYPKLVEDSLTLATSLDASSLILSPAYDLLVLDPMAPLSSEPSVGPDLHYFIWVSVSFSLMH